MAAAAAVGGWLAANAGAIAAAATVAASAASIYMMSQQDIGGQHLPPATPHTQTATIDKTQMQDQADKGKLQLGENDLKKKRKKGKAAFEIALKKQDSANAASDTGVQTKKPAQLGVQL
jgi:hypothetical protein